MLGSNLNGRFGSRSLPDTGEERWAEQMPNGALNASTRHNLSDLNPAREPRTFTPPVQS